MTHPQESRVSSTQDTFRLTEEKLGISSVEALLKKLCRNSSLGTTTFQDGGKTVHVPPTSNQEEGKMEKMFPWLSRFWELCRGSVGSKNIQVLDNLLTVYLRNVSGNVKDCHMMPNRAAMLRKSMNDVLVFFHIFYQDMKESLEHSRCLEKMTELVAMYMDMEIQASRRRKESVKKVARRITSSLFSFLDNSEEHMLDAILRTKYINKSSRELCVPVLGKILNRAPTYAIYEAMYVRYLLAFKLWKKVVANAEERKKINKIAVSRLNPPPNFLEKSKLFNDVLPKMPKSGKNITLFFMQAKFNLKNACMTFLKMCKESHPDGFSHSLSLGIDKPMYFPERLTLSGLDDRGDYIGGSTNLTNNILSSFSTGKSSLSEISQLKDILGNKPSSENCIGKKKNKNKDKDKAKANKKKVKNKNDEKKDKHLSACDKGSKKKAKKKLALDIGDIVANINLGSRVSLLKKKKIKKKGLDLGDILKNGSSNLNQLKKTRKVKKEKKAQVSANELVHNKSISIVEERLNEVEISEEKCQEVEVETKVSTIVSDINEVKDNTESVGLITVRSDTQVSEALNELTINQEDKVQNNDKNCVNSVDVDIETALPSLPDVVSSQTSVENASVILNQVNLVNSVGSEEVQEHRVIVKVDERPESAVPSSTSSTSTNILIGAFPSVENEAVAVKRTEITPVDTMSPKNVRDPVLVSSQSVCTQVPKSEPYVCDSSEVPLSGDEDCSPVVNDFSTVPIDIDTDVQILSDLRPRAAVKCDGEEEIVLGDEGNIFNTGNEDLVRDIFVQFPVPYCHNDEGVAFESTDCHNDEAVAFETTDCHNDEGVAFGANDGCETLYMYNLFTSLRGSFSQYGRKAQNFIERDFNLGEVMMELDENHSDDDSERGYEFASSCEQNSYASSERHPVRGGKVMPTGVISSTSYSNVGGINEKESSDSSPSSGVENDADSYLTSSSYQKPKSSSFSSDSVHLSGGETPHPHIALNTSALTVPLTPQNSKKFPTMNPVRCYPSAIERESPSETCTERTNPSTNRKNLSEEAEMSTPKRIHVRDLKHSEKVKSSAYNRVNVPSQFNQDTTDSPRSVALGSEKVSEPQVKDPPKSTRGRRRRSVSQTATGHDTRHSQSKKAKKDNKSNNESKKTKRDKESAEVKNGRPLTRSISLWLSQRN